MFFHTSTDLKFRIYKALNLNKPWTDLNFFIPLKTGVTRAGKFLYSTNNNNNYVLITYLYNPIEFLGKNLFPLGSLDKRCRLAQIQISGDKTQT